MSLICFQASRDVVAAVTGQVKVGGGASVRIEGGSWTDGGLGDGHAAGVATDA